MTTLTGKIAFVTGISGHVGGHLARALWTAGYEVHGLVRSPLTCSKVLTPAEWARVVRHVGDITDLASVVQALRASWPDCVFHLAAQSYVASSWDLADATLAANVDGTLNVLRATLEECDEARVLICGSSEEYGLVRPEECPVTEAQPLRPRSPYGVSKVAADFLGDIFAQGVGAAPGANRLHVVRTRAFNHCGPGRDQRFAEGSWCRQVSEIALGCRDAREDFVIWHGNLDARRDYTDSRDVARAYVLALEHGAAGEVYNICSGVDRSMAEVLDLIIARAQAMAAARGEGEWMRRLGRISKRLDPARLRPSEVPLLLGDCSKFVKATGWVREIPFEKTIDDLLAWHWREVALGQDAPHEGDG